MADSLHIVITKLDGTVVDITGFIAPGSMIIETAPAIIPPPPPPVAADVYLSPLLKKEQS